MKRTVGIVFLTASIPIFGFYLWEANALYKGPFGDELGSVAYPIPDQLRATALSALLCFFIGASLLARDFVQRRTSEKHDRSR